MKIQIPYFCLIFFLFGSCSVPSNNREQKDIVEEMIGTEIMIPADLSITVNNIPMRKSKIPSDYKIITYIDSTECTECSMKLSEWNEVIDEFKANEESVVEFLMIVNTRNGEAVRHLIERDKFMHPISIDSNADFRKQNNLPFRHIYNTFLLDSENMVIAIGNPVENPKILDLYRLAISSDNQILKEGLCVHPNIGVGAVNKGDTIHRRFSLINKTSQKYTIQAIVPSCNCIIATSESHTIPPGGQTFINIQFIDTTSSCSFNKNIDVFYKELDIPERLTINGYIL